MSVVKDRRSPHRIEFSNGSKIIGFTSGTKSGSNGDSMRGLDADMIILDEVDRMSQADIDSILAIRYTDPANRYVRAASTPTGRRAFFYQWCVNKELGWSEHHYPSSVNPMWQVVIDENTGKTLEQELRDELSEQGWIHEVLAEFGEESVGVFNKTMIDRARKDYRYYEFGAPQLPAIRVVGVDWDKMGDCGSNIAVLEWSGSEQRFKVVYREEIPRSEFTYDNAVRRIIQINDWLQPAFIYLDSGAGDYQYEMLKIHGLQHPESKLAERVKRIPFGSNIDIIDPHTRIPSTKSVKPFMVQQTQIFLERDMLDISDHDTTLWRQMENYSVVRVTTNGQEVYTNTDEHALDALMLCVLAMTREFPELAKVIVRAHNATTMGVVERKHHYDKAIESIRFGITRTRSEMDPVEALDEKYKNCRRRLCAGTGWAPRGSRDFMPRGSRTW